MAHNSYGAKIWVVEMRNDVRRRYEPTVGVALSEKSAWAVMENWQRRNPDDKFRVRCYRPHATNNESSGRG